MRDQAMREAQALARRRLGPVDRLPGRRMGPISRLPGGPARRGPRMRASGVRPASLRNRAGNRNPPRVM